MECLLSLKWLSSSARRKTNSEMDQICQVCLIPYLLHTAGAQLCPSRYNQQAEIRTMCLWSQLQFPHNRYICMLYNISVVQHLYIILCGECWPLCFVWRLCGWQNLSLQPGEKGTNNSSSFAGDFAKFDNLFQTAVVYLSWVWIFLCKKTLCSFKFRMLCGCLHLSFGFNQCCRYTWFFLKKGKGWEGIRHIL